MDLLVYLLTGMLVIVFPVLCQLSISSELIVCIVKYLANEHFNDIGIVYGSKKVNGYTNNTWLISLILKKSSIPIQIINYKRAKKNYSSTQIIFYDLLDADELLLMEEQFERRTSKFILLTSNNSDSIFELYKNSKSLLTIGRYSDHEAKFSRLLMNYANLNGSQILGSWSMEKGLQGEIFPKDWRFFLAPTSPLTVLIRHDPPFVMIKYHSNGSQYAEGYMIDLLNHITSKLNLSYKIKVHLVKQGKDFWEFDFYLKNGYSNFTEETNPDIALNPSVDTLELASSKYTGVYTGISLRLCLYESKKHMNYLDFMNTINSSCFAAVIVIAILALLILYIGSNDLIESTFTFLAITFSQGHITYPTTYSARIAIISFSISIIFLSLVCTSSLTSLAVTKRDLAQHSTVTSLLVTPPNFIFTRYTSFASIMRKKENYLRLLQKLLLSRFTIFDTVPEALSNVITSGSYVFIELERASFYFDEYRCCILETCLKDIDELPSMFLIKRNLSFQQQFNNEVTKMMESGITTELRRKWWPETETSSKVLNSLTTNEIYLCLTVFYLGLAISLFTFCIEKRSRVIS